jgi:Tfp pilus assembly protein PilN
VPIPKIVRAVNLLPPDMAGASKASGDLGARQEATGGAGPLVVLGVLAACVAGTAGYVLTTNTVKQRTADLASVAAQQQAIAGRVAELKPMADFAALANQRVATVRDLAGSRFDWEQSLRDLSRAIPADVSLKTLTGAVAPDTSAGGGASTNATASPSIDLTGCAPGQTQVARLMARLRNIDGVTRVSLSKSDTAEVAGTGAGPALDQRRAAPCGAGARPSFDVKMYFGNSKAATAGGSAPSAVATPTPTPAAGGAATPAPTPASGATTTASTSQGGATP